MPFGSSFENTKQLKAVRNCSPQGPCAIPPRQGQSQLISPVSSLNAPSCDASSSVSLADNGSSEIFVCGELEEGFGFRSGVRDSSVWMEASSVGEDGGLKATIIDQIELSRDRKGTYVQALQQIYYWYCNSKPRRLPNPTGLQSSSSFVTFGMAARWRKAAGIGQYVFVILRDEWIVLGLA